ncbi:sodium-dependent transporter [Amedibacillus dolichus]|uniref:Transporter n=1 Tax=Amedibacillus dolichus DSM 3991 TaxID=428127 RepID=A8RAV3_9FIRM|nr:sodium-dependent transporter [Amedibacillus dolichus]EDP11744.1 Sodium:neurotransmitter symporter family protein [Amedibacillus dolichus DSM 3991]
MKNREKFSSRLGFLLISAGCAVGLGNVWRFPYITGQYGGAAFVLLYLIFLVILGLPIMVMEFSVGRASQKSSAQSFDVLEPPKTKWHGIKYFAIGGNYLLMMFYTTVGGWMLNYCFKMLSGHFNGSLHTEEVSATFSNMLADPWQNIFWMLATIIIGFFICSRGLQNGVEKVSKYMMSCLFIVMLVLVVRAFTLPNAMEGLKFYLVPDFHKMIENGIGNAVFAAMGQAFFTLSLGIGSLAIFGSYIGKEHRLTQESLNVCILDTLVAFIAGLIIFPSCFSFGVAADSGPGLVFVTLPNVFNSMAGGSIWGFLFFLFMSFAALTTIIAVFENIVAYAMDSGWTRKKAVLVNFVLIIVLSLPCALGFNILSDIQPLGVGTTIQDLEDFIVSNNLLPLGSLLYLMFCTHRYGWGWKNFINEANTGKGRKFPAKLFSYCAYILPVIILVIFFQGYIEKFTWPLNFILATVILAIVLYFPIQAWVANRRKAK